MPSTYLRAPRLRRPGESVIESTILKRVELQEPVQSDRRTSKQDICGAIVTGIESGALNPGDKLPSIRRLGERLGVPHGVVRRAFEHLLSRGWLEMIHGSGTYVSKNPNLLLGQQNGQTSSSILRTVAEELTALYSTTSLVDNTGNGEIIHLHPRLRNRP